MGPDIVAAVALETVLAKEIQECLFGNRYLYSEMTVDEYKKDSWSNMPALNGI